MIAKRKNLCHKLHKLNLKKDQDSGRVSEKMNLYFAPLPKAVAASGSWNAERRTPPFLSRRVGSEAATGLGALLCAGRGQRTPLHCVESVPQWGGCTNRR